jgi:hypothetical protein
MWQHPRATVMSDVGNCTVTLQFQFTNAGVTPVVQFIEMLISLRYESIKSEDCLSFDLAIQVFAKLILLTIDQCVETDVDVIGNSSDFGLAGD